MNSHDLKCTIEIDNEKIHTESIQGMSKYVLRDYDENGNLEREEESEFKSFTGNYMCLLWGRMVGTSLVSTDCLNISSTNVDVTSGVQTNLKCITTNSGLKRTGIVCGTGTTAVAQTDNVLTWQDSLGLSHSATTLKTATNIIGSTISFIIKKVFINTSGGNLTFSEIGICTQGTETETDSDNNVLIARDVLPDDGSRTLANNKARTIEYEIKVTFDTNGIFTEQFVKELEYGVLGTSSHIFEPSVDVTMPDYAKLNSLITDDTYGIIAGTGVTAYDPTDTDVETPISHGTSAGELEYADVTTIEPTVNGSNIMEMKIGRDLLNNSGNNINIKEIGLKCKGISTPFLICRKTIDKTVEDNSKITVNVTFSSEV